MKRKPAALSVPCCTFHTHHSMRHTPARWGRCQCPHSRSMASMGPRCSRWRRSGCRGTQKNSTRITSCHFSVLTNKIANMEISRKNRQEQDDVSYATTFEGCVFILRGRHCHRAWTPWRRTPTAGVQARAGGRGPGPTWQPWQLKTEFLSVVNSYTYLYWNPCSLLLVMARDDADAKYL